jgi:hypothetical protein
MLACLTSQWSQLTPYWLLVVTHYPKTQLVIRKVPKNPFGTAQTVISMVVATPGGRASHGPLSDAWLTEPPPLLPTMALSCHLPFSTPDRQLYWLS